MVLDNAATGFVGELQFYYAANADDLTETLSEGALCNITFTDVCSEPNNIVAWSQDPTFQYEQRPLTMNGAQMSLKFQDHRDQASINMNVNQFCGVI